MPPVPSFQENAKLADWSSRIVDTVTVAASPATTLETVVATLTIPDFGGIPVAQKIYLDGWCTFTVGTSGTAARLRIKQTNASGVTVADSQAVTGGVTAAAICTQDIEGSDATPGILQYALTLQIGGASATTTVSAVSLRAIIV